MLPGSAAVHIHSDEGAAGPRKGSKKRGGGGGKPERTCSDMWEAESHCDTDKAGDISWSEAQACGAPEDYYEPFHKMADGDAIVTYDEFMKACVEMSWMLPGAGAVHIHSGEGAAGPHKATKKHRGRGGKREWTCSDMWEAESRCDTDKGGDISWSELQACGAPEYFYDPFHEMADGDDIVTQDEFMKACEEMVDSGPGDGDVVYEDEIVDAIGEALGAELKDMCNRLLHKVWMECDKDKIRPMNKRQKKPRGTITWAEAQGWHKAIPASAGKKFHSFAGPSGELHAKEFRRACKAHHADLVKIFEE